MTQRKPTKNSLAALALLAGALFLAPAAQAAPTQGQVLYQTYCTQCHGMTGNGKGVNVRDMTVQPRNHVDAEAMKGRSDADLAKVIKEGGPAISKSVLMPAWGATFSDDEVAALVKHLRVLCQCK